MQHHRWTRWMFPITGLLSLVWFVFRVAPKPSRAAYPCQRAAAPLAGGLSYTPNRGQGLLGTMGPNANNFLPATQTTTVTLTQDVTSGRRHGAV